MTVEVVGEDQKKKKKICALVFTSFFFYGTVGYSLFLAYSRRFAVKQNKAEMV